MHTELRAGAKFEFHVAGRSPVTLVVIPQSQMRFPVSCMQCQVEDGVPSFEWETVEFRDDSHYRLTCSKGHTTSTVLQQQKFQVLFEIGACGLLDGYYRESVSSFTSSLERFYEFAINVISMDAAVDSEVFAACWKAVSNQSERQLGAFIFLWANRIGQSPQVLTNKQVSFRNGVIHKGKIPTKEEALSYGTSVYSIIGDCLRSMIQIGLKDQMEEATTRHLMQVSKLVKTGERISTSAVPTILSMTCEDSEDHFGKSLSKQLEELSNRRKWMGGITKP